MKENQIEINDKSTVKRTYLQIAHVGRGLPAAILGAVLLSTALWFFCGQMTVNITGYCMEPYNNRTVLLLPMYYRTQVKAGDTVWIGKESGTIEAVFPEAYYSYEDIRNMGSGEFQSFLNSECDKDICYVYASAVFQNDITGMTEYRIVTDTVTPFQMLTGRLKHE